jgi:Xaa-Pro aminopeptidase
MVKEVETKYKFGDKAFLGFEHVTMVPMCRKLIDPTLLTKEEKQFINEYHEEVQRKTKAYFKGDEKTLAWLERETQPL